MNSEDEVLFNAFVVDRSNSLIRSAYLMTGDRGDAQDAVQAALARVYLAWPKIRDRHLDAVVEAYVRRTLLNEVLSWRRRRRVTQVLTSSLLEAPTEYDDDDFAVRDQIRRVLLQLPPQQRAVVVLRYFEDLPEASIAAALGVSAGTVKQHSSRGLARLRTLITESESEESQ